MKDGEEELLDGFFLVDFEMSFQLILTRVGNPWWCGWCPSRRSTLVWANRILYRSLARPWSCYRARSHWGTVGGSLGNPIFWFDTNLWTRCSGQSQTASALWRKKSRLNCCCSARCSTLCFAWPQSCRCFDSRCQQSLWLWGRCSGRQPYSPKIFPPLAKIALPPWPRWLLAAS